VAIVTITGKDGHKYAVLVGCGERFPLQSVNYTKGMYNPNSYLAWTDAKGTLTVKGVYQGSDDKDQPFEVTVPGYAKAAAAPAPVKIAPLPTKTTDDHGD